MKYLYLYADICDVYTLSKYYLLQANPLKFSQSLKT